MINPKEVSRDFNTMSYILDVRWVNYIVLRVEDRVENGMWVKAGVRIIGVRIIGDA